MEILSNNKSERAVLGCILNSGPDSFYEVVDLLNEETFVSSENKLLFTCIKKGVEENNVTILDFPVIHSIASSFKLGHLLNQSKFNDIKNDGCDSSNLVGLAAQIRKLEIARVLDKNLKEKRDKLISFNGTEPITELLALTEIPFEDLASSTNQCRMIGDNLKEKMDELVNNPIKQVGISTGYNKYDEAIGGGLRRGSLNIIGARLKVGKSHILNNIALHIAGKNVPILYIDTEMETQEQQFRCLSNIAGIDIKKIETGQFNTSSFDRLKVKNSIEKLEKIPYSHTNVSGMPFEQQIAIISKWVRKNKKIQDDGSINDVVVIYDYLKLTTGADMNKNLAEYQILGFMATTLHNMSVRLDIPILSSVQLNRDGIDSENTDVIAGSDRIGWLCSNFSIFKYKNEAEINLDGEAEGNRKLVVLCSRHGPGLKDGDYINFQFNGSLSKVQEGKTRYEIARAKSAKQAADNQQDNTQTTDTVSDEGN
jgi:replicative DNA helicase